VDYSDDFSARRILPADDFRPEFAAWPFHIHLVLTEKMGNSFVHICKNYAAKFFLVMISLVVSFLAINFLLGILIRFGIIPHYKSLSINEISDDVLVYKLPPHIYSDIYTEIDENGFRNKEAPDTVDAVALGDSFTYGYNVSSDDSWPQQLSKKTGKTIYNFGIGGYGPAQYYYLMDKALEMEPETILIGSFIFNDFSDSCYAFEKSDYWKQFAASNNLDISECLKNLFDAKPQVNAVKNAWVSFKNWVRFSNVFMYLKQISVVRDFVSAKRDLMVARNDSSYFIVKDEDINTIVSFKSMEALDPASEKVRAEINLAKFFYKNIKEKARGRNLAVVFIPDKTELFYDFLMSKGYELPDDYHKFVSFERALKKELSDYFDAIGIAHVNALPFMENKINKDSNPPVYTNDLNGHPTKTGYEAIAEAASEIFKNDNSPSN